MKVDKTLEVYNELQKGTKCRLHDGFPCGTCLWAYCNKKCNYDRKKALRLYDDYEKLKQMSGSDGSDYESAELKKVIENIWEEIKEKKNG